MESNSSESSGEGEASGVKSPQAMPKASGQRSPIARSKCANRTTSTLLDIRPNTAGSRSMFSDGAERSDSIASSSSTGRDATKSSESTTRAPQDGSLPPKKPKKDRSNLRKGKWTVEEEEYTSRIIHYFGTGLLTLPEGATLRSYLADKLNCDPMRITKKYAGASCLGRRVHQFRDRPSPTIAEIQLAKAELDHLEQRFRMRVEEGYSSLPLPPPSDMMLSLSQQANQFLLNSAGAPAVVAPSPTGLLSPWLLAINQQIPAAPALPHVNHGLSEQAKALSGLASLGAALPWLLPNAAGNVAAALQSPPPTTGIPNVDAAMASWAFAQAAASLAPAITQLAAANLQQQQQQQQQQRNIQQIQAQPPNVDPVKELSTRLQESRDAHSLRQALQAAIAGTGLAPTPAGANSSQPNLAHLMHIPGVAQAQSLQVPNQALSLQQQQPQLQQQPQQQQNQIPSIKRKEPPDPNSQKIASARPQKLGTGSVKLPARPRTDEDKQAGDILLGFLSSLRQSYEEALKEKGQTETSQGRPPESHPQPPRTSIQDAVNRFNQQRPHVVSDVSSGVSSSTGQQESSVEESDWNSDKKTETSSSEDSDKETNRNKSKGPPRKRLKTKRLTDGVRQKDMTTPRKL